MNPKTNSIAKNPELNAAFDFYRLRKEGVGFIEQMGSSQWTDYNTHDPGISILEALCYAITDVAFRTGSDIKDLLTTAPPTDDSNPYPDQAFFTAREILTINPWTTNDFRRILIDIDGVRNAWAFCNKCVKGLYDVLLELEADPELGDLNDHKIEVIYPLNGTNSKTNQVVVELHFPEWELRNSAGYQLFTESHLAFNSENGQSYRVKVPYLGASKYYDPTTYSLANEVINNNELKSQWRNVFYANFEIELIPSGKMIEIGQVPVRFIGDSLARNESKVKDIIAVLESTGKSGVIGRYRRKLLLVADLVRETKGVLNNHRNLSEDYCRIRGVGIEDIAVCADVEVTADADIERVQARIWHEIEKYFNPPVPFYSLQEMMSDQVPVEEIFNGPELKNGFIKAGDLEKSSLKTVLRTSDILNLLMEIEGVVAVNNLMLTKYDAEGLVVQGAADPVWNNGKPVFDDKKTSASWLLYLKDMHQPRLYPSFSRFLFYKKGLPFKPRMDETNDTLTQLRGEAERPKFAFSQHDLPIPKGNFTNSDEYFPVQYSLPSIYGVVPAGLPSNAPALRLAEEKQLKAYLLIFEQLLSNAFMQIKQVPDLFSLNPAVDKTYFAKEFTEELIKGYSEIVTSLNQAKLDGLLETTSEFRERRNRFLNHLMARFGEQFSEYALMLNDLEGNAVASEKLIGDKISFLKSYPYISQNRAKAFNYLQDIDIAGNIPGLKRRITLLLGWPANNKSLVIEHLLLRPKFPGDALYPVCSDSSTEICGDEDPYSFRLTYVMPGWIDPFNTNLEMRRFAERTIRYELPSHLLGKICWLGNDETDNDSVGFDRVNDAWHQWLKENATIDWPKQRLPDHVAAILKSHLDPDQELSELKIGECALKMLNQYGAAFHKWMSINIDAGHELVDFTTFYSPVLKPTPGISFKTNPAPDIRSFLSQRYKTYRKVSFLLWKLVHLLSKLKNIYPVATLHDFDEGNDENPVRLGSTALGNFPVNPDLNP